MHCSGVSIVYRLGWFKAWEEDNVKLSPPLISGRIRANFYSDWPVWAPKKNVPQKQKVKSIEINLFVSKKEISWKSSEFQNW